MAEQKDDIEKVEEKGGNTKLLIIIIAVLLVAVIGLGIFMFMGGSDKEDVSAETEEQQASTVKQPAIYYAVDTPFIVNFSQQSNDKVRYLQIKMKLMARDQLVIDAVKLHMPAIQHELLLLLFSQKYDVLLTSEGSKALKQACLDTINQILKSEETLENELEAVYFTSFIMQ